MRNNVKIDTTTSELRSVSYFQRSEATLRAMSALFAVCIATFNEGGDEAEDLGGHCNVIQRRRLASELVVPVVTQ